MPNFRIDVELNADGTVAGVRSVENQLSKVDKAASNTSRIMEGLERRIKQVAVAFVTIKLVQQIKDAALLSQRYAELGLALGVVGRNTNVARAALDSQAVSLQKLGISMIESRQTLLRLAAANIDLKNATELADLARNAAIVGQINTSEALNRIVLGVTNASLVTLRSVGIVTTFDSAYKDLAEQLGVNITQLTDAEKQQARLNAVLAKAPALVGLYEEPEKPGNVIEFIKKSLGAPSDTDVDQLMAENEELKRTKADLDSRIQALQAELDAEKAKQGQ